jgi:hypothetical protein
MTVTVNTLGPNSAEIVVVNETTAQPAMNAVETFLISKGWTRVSGVGNNTQRVFSAPNLTTGTKFIRINALDLHIDHAQSYTGTTTVSATNAATRWVNNDHLVFPRDNFANGTIGSVTFSTSSTQSTVTVSGLNISAGLAEVLYPGQFVRLISRANTGVYIDATVNSHDNTTGAVSFTGYHFGPQNSGSALFDWSILTHRPSYNSTTNPVYIYISASARHVAIQPKNIDGQWGDWHAVAEVENPLNIATPSILTTGWMLGNSGYARNISARRSILPNSISNAFLLNTDNAVNHTVTPTNTTSYYNKFTYWLGPYSIPITRTGRTALTASRFSKITTPIGEAGPIGGLKRYVYGRTSWYTSGVNPGTSNSDAHYYWIENLEYFRGMGDVIPNQLEPVTQKQWAFSGVAVSDLTDFLWTSQLLDTFAGVWFESIGPSAFSSSSTTQTSAGDFLPPVFNTGQWGSVNQQSQWRSQTPTLLGRIHAIKFVTTGLPAGNILSIKVDPNGFADDSGIAQEHLVMNYQSQYVADNRIGSTTIPTPLGGEGPTEQGIVRTSQSPSVAFPR